MQNLPTKIKPSRNLFFVSIGVILFFVGTGAIFHTTLLAIISNGGFETGNLDGWNTNGQAAVATAGTDPITDNSLEKVAEGKYSAVIGDEVPWMGAGPQQSSIDQTIQLPQSLPADTALQFAYAVVANDPPDHPETDKPRFRVLVEDLTSNKKLLDTEYLYTSQSSKEWYLGNGSSNPAWNQPYYMLASDRWIFRPWKQETVPLKGLGGHQIKVHFEVRDCNYGAHAIYGYLDDVRVGSLENKTMPVLHGNPVQAVFIEPPFWAPILFWFERWGLTWLCCLLPLLILLWLLWSLIKRKPRPTYSPEIVVRPLVEDEPKQVIKGGIRRKMDDDK